MTKTTSCPICLGEIHSIAGRCKHCKADLVELRERAARAARAHALGATVPPPARPLGPSAPPASRTAGGAPAEAGFDPASSPAGDSNQSATLVDLPGEAFPFAADSFSSGLSRTAPASRAMKRHGLRFARAHHLSNWSRRWPFLVGAVALLAIGISIGVLAERWRQQDAVRAEPGLRHSQASRQPALVPDRMPLPLMPAPSAPPSDPAPTPSPARPSPPPPSGQGDPDGRPRAQPEPAPAPGEPPSTPARPPSTPAEPAPAPVPDPANPGSRFAPPTSSDPGSEASAFRSFTTALTESLCQKLTQCGLIDSATQSMCRMFAQELDPQDAAEKVARGECRFNQKAADACLRAVADLTCDPGSSDRMMDWLMAPNRVGECAAAYVCEQRR